MGWYIGFGLECPTTPDHYFNLCAILCSPFLYAFSCLMGVAYFVSNGCTRRRPEDVSQADAEEILLQTQVLDSDEQPDDHDSISAPAELHHYEEGMVDRDFDQLQLLEELEGRSAKKKGMPIERKRAWDALNELMKAGEPIDQPVYQKAAIELSQAIVQEEKGLEEVQVNQVVIHEPRVGRSLAIAGLPYALEEDLVSKGLDLPAIDEEGVQDSSQREELISTRKLSLDHNENEQPGQEDEESLEAYERKIARKLAWEAMNELMRRGEHVEEKIVPAKPEELISKIDDAAELTATERLESLSNQSARSNEHVEALDDEKNDQIVKETESREQEIEGGEPQEEEERLPSDLRDEDQKDVEAKEATPVENHDHEPDSEGNEKTKPQVQEESIDEDWDDIVRGPIEDRFDDQNEDEEEEEEPKEKVSVNVEIEDTEEQEVEEEKALEELMIEGEEQEEAAAVIEFPDADFEEFEEENNEILSRAGSVASSRSGSRSPDNGLIPAADGEQELQIQKEILRAELELPSDVFEEAFVIPAELNDERDREECGEADKDQEQAEEAVFTSPSPDIKPMEREQRTLQEKDRAEAEAETRELDLYEGQTHAQKPTPGSQEFEVCQTKGELNEETKETAEVMDKRRFPSPDVEPMWRAEEQDTMEIKDIERESSLSKETDDEEEDEMIAPYEAEKSIASPEACDGEAELERTSSSLSLPPWPAESDLQEGIIDVADVTDTALPFEEKREFDQTRDAFVAAPSLEIIHDIKYALDGKEFCKIIFTHVFLFLDLKTMFIMRRVSRACKQLAEQHLEEWQKLTSGEVNVSCPFGCLMQYHDKCFEIRDPKVLMIIVKYCPNLKHLWTTIDSSHWNKKLDESSTRLLCSKLSSIECLVIPDMKFPSGVISKSLKHLECASIAAAAIHSLPTTCSSLDSLSITHHCSLFPINVRQLKCCMRSTSLGHFLSSHAMKSLTHFDVRISHPFHYFPCPYFKPLDSLDYPNLTSVRITCAVMQADAMNAVTLLIQDAGVQELDIRCAVERAELLHWLYASLTKITSIKFRIHVKDDFRKLVASSPLIESADLRVEMLTQMLLHDVSGWKNLKRLSLTRTKDGSLLPEFPMHSFIQQLFTSRPLIEKLTILNKRQSLGSSQQEQLIRVVNDLSLHVAVMNGREKPEQLITSRARCIWYHGIVVMRSHLAA